MNEEGILMSERLKRLIALGKVCLLDKADCTDPHSPKSYIFLNDYMSYGFCRANALEGWVEELDLSAECFKATRLQGKVFIVALNKAGDYISK